MRLLIAVAATAAMLAVPPVAHADLYLDKREAQSAARQVAYDRYDVERPVSAACRPWKLAYDPAYEYRRWTCGWAAYSASDGSLCAGQLRIIGRPGAGRFYYRITRGGRCS